VGYRYRYSLLFHFFLLVFCLYPPFVTGFLPFFLVLFSPPPPFLFIAIYVVPFVPVPGPPLVSVPVLLSIPIPFLVSEVSNTKTWILTRTIKNESLNVGRLSFLYFQGSWRYYCYPLAIMFPGEGINNNAGISGLCDPSADSVNIV
jgi:hypothetical protein